jgi:5'-nucleotidase
MWSRRKFIKRSLTAGAVWSAVSDPLDIFASVDGGQTLSILHTNDVHSRVEPFPLDDKKYPGMGGAAMRATIFEKLRSENVHTLIVDAGDIFQGTPYFNFFKGDVEIDLMNQMGYEAATIGNHDFDGGLETLAKQVSRAQFPFVNCNYDFADTPVAGKVHKHRIIKKGKLKIGITGCGVELNGLVPDKLFGKTKYFDPILHVQEQADILKHDEGCHLIVCLSHLGYKYDNQKVSDVVLAEQTNNIDLIIGGHTHTFLDQPDIRLNNRSEKVVINQVGWAGLQIGKLDYFFERKSKKKLSKHHTVIVSENSIEK